MGCCSTRASLTRRIRCAWPGRCAMPASAGDWHSYRAASPKNCTRRHRVRWKGELRRRIENAKKGSDYETKGANSRGIGRWILDKRTSLAWLSLPGRNERRGIDEHPRGCGALAGSRGREGRRSSASKRVHGRTPGDRTLKPVSGTEL